MKQTHSQKINFNLILGLVGILTIFLLALGTPFFATHSPYEISLSDRPLAPNQEYIFGTDQLGRDIFSRSLYALRQSLLITACSSLTIILFGSVLGILGGYYGGILDWGIVSAIDCMLAFPSLLLTIGICATLGPGSITIFISLVATGWASTARVVRSSVQSIKAKDFVTASRLLGSNHFQIIFRHIIPHCAPILSVLLIMSLATTLLAESSLSFLGFGLPPPQPTLGKLVYEGARFFRIAPWWSFFPGLLISIAIISFNLFGDSLRRHSQLTDIS